jgi:hypothetical protein
MRMQRVNAQSLIDKVMKTGKSAKSVVASLSRHGSDNQDQPQMLLGYLRPNDKFEFLDNPPFSRIRTDVVYTIVPARRGFISFSSDSSDVWTLPLEESLDCPVALVSGSENISERRFYRGDKVRHRASGALGVVIDVNGTQYSVRLEPDSHLVSCHGDVLSLVDKDATTRNYVVLDKSKTPPVFVVQFADYRSEHKTMLDALKTLYSVHRPALNRFSRLVATDPSVEGIDNRAILYLFQVDEKVWNSPSVFELRGLLAPGQSLQQLIQQMIKDNGSVRV